MNVRRMTSIGWTDDSDAMRRRSDRMLRTDMWRGGVGRRGPVEGVGSEGRPERGEAIKKL